jgi:hypothetical protein
MNFETRMLVVAVHTANNSVSGVGISTISATCDTFCSFDYIM